MVQRLTELEKESEAVNADGAETAEHTANGSGSNIELEK